MTDGVDVLLHAAVEAATAPGLVAIIADRDRTLHEGCAGYRDLERRIPMTADTVFWLASFTKLVTSIAALQLVGRGLLALDDPIETVLPEMTGYQVITGFDAAGEPQLRPPARPITLRRLLSHTSGLGYDVMDEWLLRARGDAGPPQATSLASLKGPLRFDPGEGWIYGPGVDWAGLMVEAVSGVTLGEYFCDKIFTPVGMRHSGFTVPAEDVALLYNREPDGAFVKIPSPVEDGASWEFLSGGAGLLGTAADFILLLQALLGGGGGLLSATTTRQLFEPQSGVHRAGAIATVVPGLSAPFDLLQDMPAQWSLGGLVNPQPVPGGRAAGSLGWAGWANTYYWVDPNSGLCAVLLSQHLPFAEPRMINLLRDFERAAYQGRTPDDALQ